jgi:hypothetical protein
MTPDQVERRASDRLRLIADSLVLTLSFGAIFILIKNLVNVPAPWIDSISAFHITMTLSSIAGATIAWVFHRRFTGARGVGMLAVGGTTAAAVVWSIDFAIARITVTSPGTATLLMVGVQLAGLVGLLALITFSLVSIVRPGRRRFDPMGSARIVALSLVAANVAFRFLPETLTSSSVAASLYAIVGLATLEGALGAALSDELFVRANRRRRELRLADGEEMTEDRLLRPDLRRD